jgi:hypothetical protein
MRKKVIVFKGTSASEIGAEYFFQHPLIKDLASDQVTDLYHSTLIYLNTLKSAKVRTDQDSFNPEFLTIEYINKVDNGVNILHKMVLDILGRELGTFVLNKIHRSIGSENKEDVI